jgi:uncharacterized membrane protein YwzB
MMGDWIPADANFFLRGSIAMGHAVAGLFFLRYYVRSRDQFFLMFSVAFWALGSIRVAMVFVADPMEQHYLYWVRFFAYLLILGAIVSKNLPASHEST